MRYTRLVGAILSIALVSLMAFVATPSANAASGVQEQSSSAMAAKSSARLSVSARGIKRGGKLFITGKVTPRKGPVVIQRATRCNNQGACNFKGYKKVGTNKKGVYKARVVTRAGGDYFYRARVGSATSKILRAYRF